MPRRLPVQDGPVFLLGKCALTDVVWAVVGEDSLSEIRGMLLPVLHDTLLSLDSQVVADALIGAFVSSHGDERPDDAEVLERIGRVQGDALGPGPRRSFPDTPPVSRSPAAPPGQPASPPAPAGKRQRWSIDVA